MFKYPTDTVLIADVSLCHLQNLLNEVCVGFAMKISEMKTGTPLLPISLCSFKIKIHQILYMDSPTVWS